MKKAVLLTLLTLTLFMPPVSIYLAFSTAERVELEESTDRQFRRASAELQQLDRLINEPYVLIQELNRLAKDIEDRYQNLEEGLIDGSLEKYINEHLPAILQRFDFPVQVDCYLQSPSHNSIYKLISHGDNLGLSTISRKINLINKSRRPVSDNHFAEPGRHIELTRPHTVRTQPLHTATQQMQQTLYNSFSELSLTDIERLTLRSCDLTLFLAAVKARSHLTMLTLADASDLTTNSYLTIFQGNRSLPHNLSFFTSVILLTWKNSEQQVASNSRRSR